MLAGKRKETITVCDTMQYRAGRTEAPLKALLRVRMPVTLQGALRLEMDAHEQA